MVLCEVLLPFPPQPVHPVQVQVLVRLGEERRPVTEMRTKPAFFAFLGHR